MNLSAESVYGHPPAEHWSQAQTGASRVYEAGSSISSATAETVSSCTVPAIYASGCFEAFPFPKSDPREEIPKLEAIGEKLYQARASYLVDTQRGLTSCYNRLKNPEENDERVLELRRLHEDLDRAVLEAYGGSDIEVPPFETPVTEEAKRKLESFEDEIIDRLFVLNAQRAEEERRLGLAAAAQVKGGRKVPSGKKKGSPGP